MKAALMTTGLSNCPTGGDPAVQNNFCASAAAETAPSLSNVCSNAGPNTDSWRLEVAARLERYRTRRKPRTPRYPSLLLPFDAPENWSRPAPSSGSATVATAPARAERPFTFQNKRRAGYSRGAKPRRRPPNIAPDFGGTPEQGPYRDPEQPRSNPPR